ncbi:helicase-related protein [Gulosibacter sediminis]|uniref:helicase-related protein n=1 Tax=Gulosibacter sediminis TaxID=1729695 RepID=UPI0024A8B54A|nr:helicase-related protein [Gulosibacter sediminis]
MGGWGAGRPGPELAGSTLVEDGDDRAALEDDAVSFRPDADEELTPSGQVARFDANVAAIRLARELTETGRRATPQEQRTLAAWSSWGALPQVFDTENAQWAQRREQLRELLNEEQWRAAARTTLNAHYTSPRFVAEVWRSVQTLGFTEGDVLEPGMGSGTFIGLAPEGVRATGVELDPITAEIAGHLYPNAAVRAESFADTRLPSGQFDVAVGNVPFGKVTLYDPAHNPAGHSIHNHFILKSLALTRPGGLVAVLTSRYTLDAPGNRSARRDMYAQADLLAAVRLPTGAHQRTAGTEAVTDVLLFRKRLADEARGDGQWMETARRVIDGEPVEVSTWFDDRPEDVLGTLTVGHGMYGAATLQVVTDDAERTAERLRERLEVATRAALEHGRGYVPATEAQLEARAEAATQMTDLWDGSIVDTDEGFQVALEGRLVPLQVPRTKHAELRQALELRDRAVELVQLEAETIGEDAELETQRAELRAAWEEYVAGYGPVNRYTLARTGRYEDLVDEATGEPILDPDTGKPMPDESQPKFRRVTDKVAKLLRRDPYGALVFSLERFDDETQTASAAGLLRERLLTPSEDVQQVESIGDAVSVSMGRVGRVDVDLVAELMDVAPEQAREMVLDERLAYLDPDSEELVFAPEYLSGEVRSKLEAARVAAEGRPEFERNVVALREVLPDDIPMEQIEARLGAVWVPPEAHQAFLREILRDGRLTVEQPVAGKWNVKGMGRSVAATEEWGTDGLPGPKLAEKLMEQRAIVVMKTESGPDGEDRQVVDQVATVAAQEKGEALQARFAEWVWEDPARARQLHKNYNEMFNSIVLRDYGEAGQWLTTPGLSDRYTLRPHQRAAVARMVAEPSVGLFHGVGAGKTLEMIVGVSELKRMGLVNKPLVVVPNHMLEQFSREWLLAYPRARVLAASSSDLGKEERRLFIARAAANDWDGIVLTKDAFASIGLSAAARQEYLQREVDGFRDSLDRAREAEMSEMSTKHIERLIAAREEKLAAATDLDYDPGLTFEALGVDYLVVDEAHLYKNLSVATNLQGVVSARGSSRATDLDMKLNWLRERHGERVATFATATPLSNSVTEAWVMQHYLRPDLLERNGLDHFDAWAATFGQTVTQLELKASGRGYQQRTRFAKFQNVPEMLRMWHTFADVKTHEDLNLPLPDVAMREDGERAAETIIVPPSRELLDFVDELAERADDIAAGKVQPEDDNMLKISSEGRAAALDLRLLDSANVPTSRTKLDTVADTILEEWRTTRDRVFTDPDTGEPSALRGGCQLVFSDLGTPNSEGWNVYDALKEKLVEGGVPAEAVRFIHEAKNDAEKGRLFQAVRSGNVAVLVGSTEKMGMGTNVQDRITALHHVDCPWRPADLEQRDGRAIRQGNQNPEVKLFRYVTERSFDTFMWQTVERKAKFIAQVMRGRLDVRELDDIGDAALGFAETKAIASGDPLVLDRANAESDLQRLRRAETAHHRAQTSLEFTARATRGQIGRKEREIEQLRAAIARTTDVGGDKFKMRIGESTFTKRQDAREGLAEFLQREQQRWQWMREGERFTIGHIGGHEVELRRDLNADAFNRRERHLIVSLKDVPDTNIAFTASTLLATDGYGPITSIERRAAAERMTKSRGDLERALEDAHAELAAAEGRLGRPFAKKDELEAARARYYDIVKQMEDAEKGTSVDAGTVVATDAPASAPTAKDGAGPNRPSAQQRQPGALDPYAPSTGSSWGAGPDQGLSR